MMRRPDVTRATGDQPAALGKTHSATTKSATGRPEAQGNRVHRNACQPAPTWAPSKGADAAADLERALARWPRW